MPDAPVKSLRGQLRDATAAAHARVDALMAGSLGDASTYTAYVAGMHAFSAALLPSVRAQADALAWPLPDWARLLREDLATLGAAPLGGIAPQPVRDRPRALGALYVLEGSSLGARLLVRQARALGHDAARGAAFLHAHAQGEGGHRWPRFLALLEFQDIPGTDVPACAAANEAFDLAERCLRRAKERLQ